MVCHQFLMTQWGIWVYSSQSLIALVSFSLHQCLIMTNVYISFFFDSGNPRRFQSQDVVRMEAGSRSRSQPIDGPLEEIETEGQRQLQTILRKQLDTNVSIQQYVTIDNICNMLIAV